MGTKIDRINHDDVISCYNENKDVHSVVSRFNISEWLVKKILELHNINIPSKLICNRIDEREIIEQTKNQRRFKK